MTTPIHDFLKKYENSSPVRCHMPGGKGLVYPRDITEIKGADVLYESSGVILESERNAASLFGAAATCYSCGGSTLAIQAMLCAVRQTSPKKRLTAGRFSHKSLINSAALLGYEVDWLYPDSFLSSEFSPKDIDRMISGDTAAVFLNSIDYYGGETDIADIARVCRERGVSLLIDNAHGAYRAITGGHPITRGAAMTADSAHKTLPALTGAAYLHIAHGYEDRFYPAAKAAMSVFGSSSPSYLMLESLDLCNRFISEEKARAMQTADRISRLKKELRLLGMPLRESDEMRITISVRKMGYSGDELADLLRRGGIECEMSDSANVVLLFSPVQPEGDFDRILGVLRSVEKKPPLCEKSFPVIRGTAVLPPREALFSPSETLPLPEAVGRISAESCCPCPPCVPLIMAGEVVTAELAELLKEFGVEYLRVIKT